METSIFIAKALSVMYLAVSTGIFFNGDHYRKEMEKMLENWGLMYIGGIMALAIGVAMVNYHNIWEKSWITLITIIGWLALTKGLILMIFPKTVEIFKPLFRGSNIYKIGAFTTILGLVFGYFGFIA